MKNLEEYLLEKIAEEAGELVQTAMKASEFGLGDFNLNENKTNIEVLVKEANDVAAQVEMLREHLNGLLKPEWKLLWNGRELDKKQNKCAYYALTNSYMRGKLSLTPEEHAYLDNKLVEYKKLITKEEMTGEN